MARQALGKGLNALIKKTELRTVEAAPEEEVDEGRVIIANPDEIQASPFQPRRRFNEEQIKELADSIHESGLIQPLIVRRVEGKYELIAGERRLRAIRSLGLKEVRVVVKEATDREVAELTLIENLQREDLTPLEEAEQYRLLQTRFAMSQEVIARHVGKSRAAVANMVRLLDLAAPVRELLESSGITVGHAKVLLQLKEEAAQISAATRVAEQGLTVRQTEQLVRSLLNPEQGKLTPPAVRSLPAAYEQVCQQLSRDFGTKVNISLKGKNNGVIEIPYVGKDELVRILQIFGVNVSV
ncbi:MAG: ParB/RepB/Spo0J family partition protein [Akkermansia sp.]|nr:ParB/RepB/Spo0J family partition protein [Akkermansia sp.]